nr:MAG TPA: hypothetical protein [Caudoviricetes sp.]
MDIVIFLAMALVILYLMHDNRRLEKMNRIAVKAAVKEQIKRKALEVLVYGRELDNQDIFEDEALYED